MSFKRLSWEISDEDRHIPSSVNQVGFAEALSEFRKRLSGIMTEVHAIREEGSKRSTEVCRYDCDLSELLARRRLTREEVTRVDAVIAEMHSAGIYHGYLIADCIYLNLDGEGGITDIRIGDFEFAVDFREHPELLLMRRNDYLCNISYTTEEELHVKMLAAERGNWRISMGI